MTIEAMSNIAIIKQAKRRADIAFDAALEGVVVMHGMNEAIRRLEMMATHLKEFAHKG
jgi:hypothetical protein